MKDQKHLLKNIHRRKPIHSHSQPQGSIDPERTAFEEEIDKLTREKAALEGNLSGFKEQHSAAKVQLETLTQRIGSMEQRQEKLLSFVEKALQNPEFIGRLSHKLESMDFSAYSKKRRLPQADDDVQSIQDNVLVDKFDICDQDFCNKLRLELSTSVSDVNLLSHSTQSSNEDGMMSPQGRTNGWPKELCDTGASLNLNMDSASSCKLGPMHSSIDEGDCNIACLLNLTLASSPLDFNKSPEITDNNEVGNRAPPNEAQTLSSSSDVNKQAAPTEKKRVNDVFWEQFLTERPGCSDTEEANSSYKAGPHDEQDERRSVKGVTRNTKGMEHLTL